jgi:hypothetical protein
MRFMMLVKADTRSEAGVLPSETDLETMGRYNEELVRAGVLVDGAGLQPTSRGAKVTFVNGTPQVTDGPFAETKEIIAGYWIIDVKSRDEAIDWAKRVPFSHLPNQGRQPEIEVRQMFDVSDFPDVPANVAELDRNMKARRSRQTG